MCAQMYKFAKRNSGVSVSSSTIRATTEDGVIVVQFDCTSIELDGHSLRDDDVKDLLDALVQGKFTRVNEIDLTMNCLSDVSAELIAQFLKTNSTVTSLHLVSCMPIDVVHEQS